MCVCAESADLLQLHFSDYSAREKENNNMSEYDRRVCEKEMSLNLLEWCWDASFVDLDRMCNVWRISAFLYQILYALCTRLSVLAVSIPLRWMDRLSLHFFFKYYFDTFFTSTDLLKIKFSICRTRILLTVRFIIIILLCLEALLMLITSTSSFLNKIHCHKNVN